MTFTSIQTAGGWQVNTVTQAYDLLFRRQLNALPTCRQFVDVEPEQVTHTGSSVVLNKKVYFSESVINAAKTPLTEESDVTATQVPATSPVTLTPNEYGMGTVRTLKLANRSMVPLDPWAAEAVADAAAKVVDELLQDKMITGSQVYYAAGTSTATVTATSTVTAQTLRKSVTKLRTNMALTRDGSFYAGIIHPNVSFDIRSEAGSGGWRVPNEYGTSQLRIWRGEIGEFEGIRFIENPRTRKANDGVSSGTVYRSFILGKEALAQIVVVEPHVVVGPVVDTLYRFRPLGWYGDFGFNLFRDEAIVRIESGTGMS